MKNDEEDNREIRMRIFTK